MSVEITCTEFGNCNRSDGVELRISKQPYIKLSSFTQDLNFDFKPIETVDPFENLKKIGYLKNSEKFTCADGFGECMYTCCFKGLCKDPGNVCYNLENTKGEQVVYIPVIIFMLLFVVYWIFFVYIGIRYARKSATSIINKTGKSTNNKNDLGVNFNEKKTAKVDQFDDPFNRDQPLAEKGYDIDNNFKTNELFGVHNQNPIQGECDIKGKNYPITNNQKDNFNSKISFGNSINPLAQSSSSKESGFNNKIGGNSNLGVFSGKVLAESNSNTKDLNFVNNKLGQGGLQNSLNNQNNNNFNKIFENNKVYEMNQVPTPQNNVFPQPLDDVDF